MSFFPQVWPSHRVCRICAFSLAGLALSPLIATAQQVASVALVVPPQAAAQPTLPDAPSALLISAIPLEPGTSSSAASVNADDSLATDDQATQNPSPQSQTTTQRPTHQETVTVNGKQVPSDVELDANGNPIPLNRQQPKRILGFMPNFRSVSGGAVVHPPGWKYNFQIATHQATDYSSFIFLGLTTISAEGINSHPVLGKGVDGFYAYLWRGFLDKTDGTYLSAWLLPSLLHEDTRYYAMGNRRSIPIRALYVISRQVVTQTYGGGQTPNIAGLGGKVLTQIVSREYYPSGATSFGVLATKFAYSAMRDIAFTSVREFYPDVAAHYIRKHREKAARLSAKDVQSAGTP
ncbi:MAG TPA: hypothetical protein VGG18_01330 [Granulicella sp.]